MVPVLDDRNHQIRVDDGISAGSALLDPPDDPPGHARAQGAGADDAAARRSCEGAQTADSTSPVPVVAVTTAWRKADVRTLAPAVRGRGLGCSTEPG